MLLQKCWAKIYGSYEAIDSGTASEGFQALTGAPTEYLSQTSKNVTESLVKKKLKQAYTQRSVVTASGSKTL